MRRLLCAFVCVVSLGTTGKAQRAPIEFNWWDANDLLRQLLVAIDPARPENIYMPQLLREKIAWVFSENKAGRLILNFSPSPQRDRNGKENRGALMDATKNQSGALVNIYAGTLMYFVRYKRGVRQGFDEVSKDGFALSLAHEAIHLTRSMCGARRISSASGGGACPAERRAAPSGASSPTSGPSGARS